MERSRKSRLNREELEQSFPKDVNKLGTTVGDEVKREAVVGIDEAAEQEGYGVGICSSVI